MRSKLGDIARLKHILDTIVEIENYLLNNNFDEFLGNSMMRFACVKQMEIIGEAANHISKDFRNKFSEIEWEQIVGMRNVFGHEYFGIDAQLIWDIIKADLPTLKETIIKIIDEQNNIN